MLFRSTLNDGATTVNCAKPPDIRPQVLDGKKIQGFTSGNVDTYAYAYDTSRGLTRTVTRQSDGAVETQRIVPQYDRPASDFLGVFADGADQAYPGSPILMASITLSVTADDGVGDVPCAFVELSPRYFARLASIEEA